MGKYFGTDGFRGQAGWDLLSKHAYLTGRFLGLRLKTSSAPRVAIGMDTRLSGGMFAAAAAAGLAESGAEAVLLGVVPTPCLSYVVQKGRYDAGIMITASHNPYLDNGIKLLNADGEKLSEDILEELERVFDGDLLQDEDCAESIGRVVYAPEETEKYEKHLEACSLHRLDGKKIALDAANGSASFMAERIFSGLGAEVLMLHASPDGKNINVRCGSTDMASLSAFVKKNGCDAGFAFDGDADRCLAVDEDGNPLSGDHILYICARAMQKRGKLPSARIAVTVMSNLGLIKALERCHIGCDMTQVGDKYVYEDMKACGLALGGEQSGHIIFAADAATGDGMLTAIKAMNAAMEEKKSFKELRAEMSVYPQVLKNVAVADKKEAMQDMEIEAAKEELEEALAGSGRILLRPSGTEPLIRVMAEAEEKEKADSCVDTLVRMIEKKYGKGRE